MSGYGEIQYRLNRDVTTNECGWLTATVSRGETVFRYTGHTYGCIGPDGIAVSRKPNETPFFELPADALDDAKEESK